MCHILSTNRKEYVIYGLDEFQAYGNGSCCDPLIDTDGKAEDSRRKGTGREWAVSGMVLMNNIALNGNRNATAHRIQQL
ncbi:hypothetical protein N7488_006321 [Penicillium malachiteum]|nr:hypothetical protein N7488_006321 [Penicillium malachiteum]